MMRTAVANFFISTVCLKFLQCFDTVGLGDRESIWCVKGSYQKSTAGTGYINDSHPSFTIALPFIPLQSHFWRHGITGTDPLER